MLRSTVFLTVVLIARFVGAQDKIDTPNVTPWSEPVNGIQARIEAAENASESGWWTDVSFVRLKNVTDHSLVIPLQMTDDASVYSVELLISGKWETVVADKDQRLQPPAAKPETRIIRAGRNDGRFK